MSMCTCHSGQKCRMMGNYSSAVHSGVFLPAKQMPSAQVKVKIQVQVYNPRKTYLADC